MNELHADPVTSTVAASDSSTATGYGALATAGPAVTKTLVNGQKVLVLVSCSMGTIASGDGYMSFAVSGATTLASSDANAAICDMGSGVNVGNLTVMQMTVFTATAGGSHTFTAQYKTNGNTMTFSARRIVVKPF